MRPILRNASRIAGRQHGAVTTAQLLALGLSRSAVKRWHAKGLLHREFRGVWRFGHRAPSYQARYTAAVLACGEGAALSGPAAQYHYGLRRGDPPPPEVTAPTERAIPGIRTRQRTVPTRIWNGIPTTTVPQTIADLAPVLSLDALALVCHEADVRFGVTRVEATNRPGAAKLRAIYDGDHDLILGWLERELRRLLSGANLPLPRFNRRQGRHYVDCRWPGLTVELDGYRFHRTRHAWEQDQERRRAARRRGDEFRRYTHADLTEHPAETIAEIAGLLPAPRT
jgi:hypothetical protein